MLPKIAGNVEGIVELVVTNYKGVLYVKVSGFPALSLFDIFTVLARAVWLCVMA